MKKFLFFLVVGLFLGNPFAAGASMIGTGDLAVSWGGGVFNNWYTDYNGIITNGPASVNTIGTTPEDIFCVSHDNANGSEPNVSFYTFDGSLGVDTTYYSGNIAGLRKAAWVADNYAGMNAQIAIWMLTGVYTGSSPNSDVSDIFSLASGKGDYTTSSWVLAVSGGLGSSLAPKGYQDYLVPTKSVPEPTQMLLFGTALIGLAGVGRKRFLKK
jgi:hypothetical protein